MTPPRQPGGWGVYWPRWRVWLSNACEIGEWSSFPDEALTFPTIDEAWERAAATGIGTDRLVVRLPPLLR